MVPVSLTSAGAAPPLSGAIFTTTEDGSIVNENVRYEAKEDVYLDGGPGPNAPSKAAGLPEGDYYFQVTDPSGKDLLSTDHISNRKFHVNENGVIDYYYTNGINYEWSNKDKVWVATTSIHNTGIDVDHSELGAITVQLYPYDDTPNPGGVYKVWATPVEDYAGDHNYVPTDKKDLVNGENYQPGNYHGFIPSKSKTDNYKVRYKGKPYYPPELTVKKFHDSNANGIWDEGEEEVIGWAVDVTDTLGVTNTVYTPEVVLADAPGTYTFVESTPAGTLQTASYLDGVQLATDPTVAVAVAGDSGETHEVVYGNVGLGAIQACKIYDRDGDGVADADEPGVLGWQIELTGIDVTGAVVGPIVQVTGDAGCTVFSDLLPGTYTVTELIPASGGWVATGDTSYTVTIVSSLDGSGSTVPTAAVAYTNYAQGYADFGTKGYWHNKNGLAELTEADIDYVNGLDPYDAPSTYFGAGDEPFDGYYENGTPVDASNGILGDTIALAGTWQSEVSQFLVDSNAGDEAIAAWASDDAAWQTELKTLLDTLNNSDALPFIYYNPPAVIY
jgi:hypothetical protein